MNLRRFVKSQHSRLSPRARRTPGRVALLAGRPFAELEQIEPRFMLAGDHPSLPGPWTPNPAADTVNLNTAAAVTASARGRDTGWIDQSNVTHNGAVTGTITSGDPGDLFKFVVTGDGVAGHKDFVSVLADTTSVVGTTLDTYVEIYDSNGNLIQSGADNGSGQGLSGLVTVGLNSLLPASSRAPDGWAGFEGVVGQTYYVRVRADPNPDTAHGRTATGSYALKIDAATIAVATNNSPDVVANGVTIPNIDFGRAFAENVVDRIQQDVIFRVTTPNSARFDSLAMFQAISDDNAVLNPHLDVYSSGNAQGVVQRLATDTDAGRQTDSFTTYFTARNTTYYVRVRADDIRTVAQGGQPTGNFQMLSRFAANNIPVDLETRLGQTARVITASDDPGTPWSNVPLRNYSSTAMIPRGGTDAQIFKFTAQGTGLGVATTVSQLARRGLTTLPPLPQPAMRLYDEQGNSLDFNKGNGGSQLIFSVTGNHTYFLVIEGFDNAADGGFKIFLELHHTYDATQPVDDHINTPTAPSIIQWEQATPLRFGNPFQPTDVDGNPASDSVWKQTAVGRGRLIAPAGQHDTDLFQFTAPVNQLSTFAGDDTNTSLPLYVGGNFAQAGFDPRTGQAYNANNIAVFDAGQWFNAGAGTVANGAFNGPIFAMAVWDADGGGPNLPVLAVGGHFSRVNNNPASNIAFRVFDPGTGSYAWSTDPLTPNSANPLAIPGDVHALAVGDAIPVAIQGFASDELYVGGQFVDGNANNIEGFADVGGQIGRTTMNGGVTGANADVRAITIWDPPAPGNFPSRPTDPAAMPPPTNTNPPTNLVDPPAQVFFGGVFSNGFANNPAAITNPVPTPDAPGPNLTNLNNLARWGVRNIMGDVAPTLQGNSLPNGYNITWGNTQPTSTPGIAVPVGNGVNGPVNALAIWDDPGQYTGLPAPDMRNGMDIPVRLIIGGQFTSSGTTPAPSGTAPNTIPGPAAVPAQNVIAYNITQAGNGRITGFPSPAMDVAAAPRYENIGDIAQGQVRALTIWHRAINNAGMVDNGMEQSLMAAGDDTVDPGVMGIIQELDTSGNAPMVMPPIGRGWNPFIFSVDGTIRTITAFKNNAIGVAPGINQDTTKVDFETVYFGGDFTQLTDGQNNFFANHVARLTVDLHTPDATHPGIPNFDRLYTTNPPQPPLGNMDNGVMGIVPGEGTTSSVFVLLPFNDNVQHIYDRTERPASRVAIRLDSTLDSSLGATNPMSQAQIRVYDSNFQVIYQFPNNAGALNLDQSGQTHTPGANDPSVGPFFPQAGAQPWWQTPAPYPGFTVWAGEVYYVEVSDPGPESGRYTLSVTTDALPPRPDPATQDPLGTFPDGTGTLNVPPGAGQFAMAPEIQLNAAGRGRAFGRPLDAIQGTWMNMFPSPEQVGSFSGHLTTVTAGGVVRVEASDSPVISRVGDTMLFQFRAQNDGAAEIRLATLGIQMGFQEAFFDQDGNPLQGGMPNLLTKTINSPFHGAIRVFNNDFVQLGYSSYNDGVSGYIQTVPTMDPGDGNYNPPETTGLRNYRASDPRLVVPIRRGNTYFVQVESAYKGTNEINPDLVDWRFATGAYDLTINSTPSLFGVDDHYPSQQFQAPANGLDGTPIPVDRVTGAGTMSGIIRDIPTGTFANPNDVDTFQFVSLGRGFASVRITPTTATLAPHVSVYLETLNAGAYSYPLVVNGNGGPGVAATVQFAVSAGQRFYIAVDGAGSEGSYTVDLTSPVQPDDQPFSTAAPNDITNPVAGWANAKQLRLNRFLGLFGDQTGGVGPIAALNGAIQNPGDTDLFKFTAESYEMATVTVHHVDNTLDPFVRVYEITRDGSGGGTPMNGQGKEVFLRIAFNADVSQNNTDSSVRFSITPGRDYYVLVSGTNLANDFGRYTLAVNVSPTDDHPDDPLLPAPANLPDPSQPTDFPSGSIITLNFDQVNFTSTGTATGVIERNTDTDLFRFSPQATGAATVSIARAAGSTLALDIIVLDANNTPISGLTYTPGAGGSITVTGLNVASGQQYFLLVRPNATLPPGTTDTGGYSITVNTTPADDFLPTPGTSNPGPGDFAGATNIPLNGTTGIGTQNGTLVPIGDSDIFKFTTIAAGTATVRISTPLSTLNPRVVIYDATHTQVFAANGNGDSASVSFNANASAIYYVLVLADPSAANSTAVGAYTVTVTSALPGGGGGGGGGPDDFPNAGEWSDAAALANIGLDTRTGFGSINGVINTSADTDLFHFTAPATGFVDIQLNTPVGGLVDGQLALYNAAHTLIAQDSAGINGATGAIRFMVTGGAEYFILVSPVGSVSGSYTLRLAAQPMTNFLYFPEGFAGSTINEFLPMVNPNNYAVSVAVFARYETGDNPNTPIYTGTIPANSRGGITISTAADQAHSLVRIGAPYSLEIQSTGPLGATFSHYDFNTSVGESFTNKLSTTWTFAEVNKDHNNYRDFLLFYNPGSTTANIAVTLYYQDGGQQTFMATVDGLRRGGIAFDTDSRVTRTGKFGVSIVSDQPIVASVSSYNLPRSGGDGLLGDSDGGNTRGVVGNISSGAGATSTISILNTNNQPATVTIVADYGRADIPKLTRVYTINPHAQFTKSLAAVGLIPGQTAGLTYSSNLPITFEAIEYKLGDGDITTTASSAAREFFFGDLFVNPSLAGLKYIEQMGLYNPSQVGIDVQGTILFADNSAPVSVTFHVNPSTFTFVQIDQLQAILSRPAPTAFSLVLNSASPFIASMTHYDLFLNGGWSALGAPIGLTSPLTSLA